MAEQLNWRLNSSTSTPLTSEQNRIQVVEVFLKNQHPPRLLSLGDTAETCRFFRGSSAPQLTSDAKSSKKLPEASTNLDGTDGTTGGWTSGRRFKGGRHAVYSSKKHTYEPSRLSLLQRFHLRLCGDRCYENFCIPAGRGARTSHDRAKAETAVASISSKILCDGMNESRIFVFCLAVPVNETVYLFLSASQRFVNMTLNVAMGNPEVSS